MGCIHECCGSWLISLRDCSLLCLKGRRDQEKWEEAKVTPILPIFKKCKEEDPGNYRPVSVTLTPGKVMEQILLEVICKRIKDMKVIRSSRHGFTKGKSCLAKLIAFYDETTSSVDRERASNIVCCDTSVLPYFSKPFVTVSITAS